MAKKLAGEYIMMLKPEVDNKALKVKAEATEKKMNVAMKRNKLMELRGAKKHGSQVATAQMQGAEQVTKKKGGKFLGGFIKTALDHPIVATVAGAVISGAIRLANLDPNNILNQAQQGTGNAYNRKYTSSFTGLDTETISKFEEVAGTIGMNAQQSQDFLSSLSAKTGGTINPLTYLQKAIDNIGSNPAQLQAVSSAFGIDPKVLSKLAKESNGNIFGAVNKAKGISSIATSNESKVQKEVNKSKVRESQALEQDVAKRYGVFINKLQALTQANIDKARNSLENFALAVDSFAIRTKILNSFDGALRNSVDALKEFAKYVNDITQPKDNPARKKVNKFTSDARELLPTKKDVDSLQSDFIHRGFN